MHEFPIHTLDTAPEESKEMLKQYKNGAGFIPNMHAVMAANYSFTHIAKMSTDTFTLLLRMKTTKFFRTKKYS